MGVKSVSLTFVHGLRARAAITLALPLIAAAVASCGDSGGGGASPAASGTTAGKSGPKTVELKLTDAGCDPATLKLDAGRTTFKVTNAGTGRVSELEVLSGQRI